MDPTKNTTLSTFATLRLLGVVFGALDRTGQEGSQKGWNTTVPPTSETGLPQNFLTSISLTLWQESQALPPSVYKVCMHHCTVQQQTHNRPGKLVICANFKQMET